MTDYEQAAQKRAEAACTGDCAGCLCASMGWGCGMYPLGLSLEAEE
ncbi:MAG: hypothetical protein LBG81_05785 [Coriobacteriaceae bacterium]|jgi:hypothetical protein|nr:hypothetical protein [Coriobacteriaceae bacterium]